MPTDDPIRAKFAREAATGAVVSHPRTGADEPQRVVLARIDVPIGDLILLMFKLLLASIPIAILVVLTYAIIRLIMG